MKPLLLFILAITAKTYAQDIHFKELKRKPNPKFYSTSTNTIYYPLVVIKNKIAERAINDCIKQNFFHPDDEKSAAEQLLNNEVAKGLTDLSYEVTFKNKNILSLNLFAEGCRAYCSSWHTYFNFDLNTGKTITIQDMVLQSRIDSLRTIVLRDKTDSLTKYKVEEKNSLDSNEIDSDTYDWIMDEITNNCMDSADISKFALYKGYLEIIDPCDLPHAIQSQTPIYELKYSYLFLKPFLKKEFIAELK